MYFLRNVLTIKNTEELANSIVFGTSLWGALKEDSTIIDPETKTPTTMIVGVYPRLFSILLPSGAALSDCIYEPSKFNSGLDMKTNKSWAERVEGKAISSYTSPGCFAFNIAIINLPKWIFKKISKKENLLLEDEFTSMLKSNERHFDKDFKSYLKKISKKCIDFMNGQNKQLIKQPMKYTIQNVDYMIKNALQHLVIIPTLVALLYCACVPQGDRMCNEIYCNDIMRCFPEEAAMFSKEIEYHLTQSQMFNTKGILDINGGKVSVNRVKLITLVVIAPYTYVNLHCVREECERLKRGERSLKEFKSAIHHIDRYASTSCVYVTSKDKYTTDGNRWLRYGVKIGYFVSRFGYDIAGEVLGVERPSGTCLDLDDDFNLKRQEMITKFDEEFNVYDQDGYMESTKDSHFDVILNPKQGKNYFAYLSLVGSALSLGSFIYHVVDFSQSFVPA